MKEHEKRRIIEEEIKSVIQKEMKRIDIRRLVDELMSEIIEQHMRNYQFPEKSIPANSIDFDGFTLSQEACVIDSWDNFKSSGISDDATQNQISITDDGVHIHNLSVDSINLKKHVKIGNNEFNKLAEGVYNTAMARFKSKFEKIDWVVENIVKLQNEKVQKK